jgi:hypothetical protein
MGINDVALFDDVVCVDSNAIVFESAEKTIVVMIEKRNTDAKAEYRLM